MVNSNVDLCDQLLLYIAEYVQCGKDLAKLCLVSKHWNELFSDDRLWKQLCTHCNMQPLQPMTRTRGVIPFKRGK